jgi:hypothetical protein
MIRKLIWIVAIAGLAWAGYWFVGSSASKSATEAWLEDRRTEGWQVEYSDLSVRGFPNRFDTTLTDLQLTDPETGVSWSAPFFQLFALSYKPNHIIAVWPDTQTIATPFQKIDITSSKMTASLVVKAKTSLELDRANLIVENARVTSSEGWEAGVDDLKAAIRQTDGPATSYDIASNVSTLIPSQAMRDLLDQGGTLPDRIESLALDSTLTFDAPLDRSTIERARPNITALKLNNTSGIWGELELRAKGDMTINEAGSPTGELALNARNWREMLKLAATAGAIPQEAVRTAEFALGLLAGVSGGSETLDAPLSFSKGRTYLGPIPIGPAPTIKLR